MAGNDEAPRRNRHHRQAVYLRHRRPMDRRCCCSSVQFRAIFLIFTCVVLIFVAEYWDVASYLLFVGSIGIFMGIFLILLDISLYMQARSERNHRRFGRSNDVDVEAGGNSVWTTSTAMRTRSSSFTSPPPDYATTMSQPEVYPFPTYIQDGISSSSIAPPSTTNVHAYENDVHDDDDDDDEDGEDKLPTYEEVMDGFNLPTIHES